MRRALVAALALLLAGCAPLAIHSPKLSSPLARAQATHEYPSPSPPAERVSGAAASPTQAIEAFATTYINWSARTLVARLRTLAARSIGQARSAMTLAASQSAGDYELQRGGVENRGTVEAVAPVIGQRDQYVVATREQTSATDTAAYQGLAPAWHLTLVTVSEVAAGQWVVSGWQPES
jgi:type IV pilus biogenesis protein CpaD/CtpE